MKCRLPLLLMLAVMLTACNRSQPRLETGDLIFVGIPYDYQLDSMSSAIVCATGDTDAVNYIHVAIVERVQDSLYIIDATLKHGVSRYPMAEFVEDFKLRGGSLPHFDAMRLSDTTGVSASVQRAKQFVGRGYDLWFLPDNEEQYCSELVQNAYLDPNGNPLFDTAPMNFLAPDGSMPPYWQELFALLGREVPQGVMGTNPNDMSHSPRLTQCWAIDPLAL